MIIRNNPIIPYIIGLLFAALGGVNFSSPSFFITPLPLWLSIIIITVSLVIVVLVEHSRIIVDKFSGNISIVWRNLVRKKKWDLSISSVKQVVMKETLHNSDKGTKTMLSYPLYFVQQDGTQLDFISHPVQQSGNVGMLKFISEENRNRAVGQRVAKFIGVPFVECNGLITSGVSGLNQESTADQMVISSSDVNTQQLQ